MKRIVCTSIALLMLLTGCFTPTQAPEPSTELSGDDTHGIYEFIFDVEQLSGWPFDDWNFVYTYDGEEVKSGHQILFSLEIFSFHSIQAEVIEKDAPNNVYSATFPVAICDGGFGKTEITVTGSDGRMATFKITCNVTQVGNQ